MRYPWIDGCSIALHFRLLLLLLFSMAGTARASETREIWLQPWAPCIPCGWTGETDIDQIFSSDREWSVALSGLRVFVFTPFQIDRLGNDGLKRAAYWLRLHHIDADVDIEAMPINVNCGKGIEGYGDPVLAERIAHRLRTAGIVPKYLSMDEPLWGGHYLSSCKSPISKVVADITSMVHVYKNEFPDIEIGDTEPYAAIMAQGSWRQDLGEFVRLLNSQPDLKLTSVTIDSGWSPSWQANTRIFVDEIHRLGLRAGVIYDAISSDRSDPDAIGHIITNFAHLEDELNIPVDFVSFGGWYKYPDHLLPEADPGSQTYALRKYLGPRSSFSLEYHKGEIGGELRWANGLAISHAAVEMQVLQGSEKGPFLKATLAGYVPSWASKALVGVRVNTEGNAEEYASLTVAVGSWNYGEAGPAATAITRSFLDDLSGSLPKEEGGAELSEHLVHRNKVLSIVAGKFDPVIVNGPLIDVHAGLKFSLSIGQGLSRPAFGSAYGVLIFFSDDLARSERHDLQFDQKWVTRNVATTDSRGRFSIPCLGLDSVDGVRVFSSTPKSAHPAVSAVSVQSCS